MSTSGKGWKAARTSVGVVFLIFLAITLGTALLRFRLGPFHGWGLGMLFLVYVLLGLRTLEWRPAGEKRGYFKEPWKGLVFVGLAMLGAAGFFSYAILSAAQPNVVLLMFPVPMVLAAMDSIARGLRIRRSGRTPGPGEGPEGSPGE